MLSSFTITLCQTSAGEWTAPEATGGFVRGMFYDLLRSTFPELADEIHSSSLDAPFTVSPLMRMRSEEGEAPSYRVRFTTMTEPVFDAVCRALYARHKSGESVRLSKADFEIRSLDFKDRRGLCRLARYEDLLNAPPLQTFAFRFMTPTAFKNGRMNVPLPIPRLMFQGYLRKWNRFAPPDLRIEDSLAAEVEEGVAISRHDIRTRVLDMQAMKMIGFTGECVLAASGMDTARLRELSALARFAFFSGTGAKTTIGMGQTGVGEMGNG